MIISQLSGDDEEDLSVNFRGVSFSKTSWTIHGLNLFIIDSNLANVEIFIRQNTTCQICGREAQIVKSMFGHMNIRGGYDIHMSDCIVDGATVTLNASLLDVMGGTLSISNSSFQHLSGNEVQDPGLLRAEGCRIHMVSVNCSNNKAPGGLIQIQNGSELFVQNSIFIKNGPNSIYLSPSSVIFVKFKSSLFISDSLFSGNAAHNGSCLWLHHNVSVTISQSNFVNNTADYGGVIYQYYEPENGSGQNHSYEQSSVEQTQSYLSSEGRRQQSQSIHPSYFLNNKVGDNSGVAYFDGASIVLFVKMCEFTGNYAVFEGGAIYTKNLTGYLIMEQCIFTNNSVIEIGGSLSLTGTHSQLISCEFSGDSGSDCDSTVDFQYGTSFIYNCTFSEQVSSSITAIDIKLNVTDSRFNGHKKHCFIWDNSEITIIGCQFAVYNGIFYYADYNWSNLTVINTSFTHGQSVFTSVFRSWQVQFINCLFYIQVGYVQIGNIFFKNCTISNLKEQFIHSNQFEGRYVVNPTGPAQLDIVDCVFMENNVSGDQSFIYVENASFTMTNCLYSGNDVRNHIMLNGTTDVTITDVTFFNNSLENMDDPGNEKSLFIVNNTAIKINNCNFESNYFPHGSLIFVFGGEVRVTNSVMSNNTIPIGR